jgi:hypothetical protein
MRRLFVEDVAGIAVVGKESEAYGTLLALSDLEMLRTYTIVAKEVHRLSAHDICASIAYEGAGHTSASDTDDAVETASAMHCCLGLTIAKEDVEHGLSYPDYFPVYFHCMLLTEHKDSKKCLPTQNNALFSALFCFKNNVFAPFV